MANGNKEQNEKILQLVLNAILRDKELREEHQVGEKFRFIRDRLHALQLRVEETIRELQKEVDKKQGSMTEDEAVVYIYIYNAQGIVLQTWQKMVSPSVFYEYSINRPVYSEKTQVESFIRSRPNKIQHGYISVVVKKQDILPISPEAAKDSIGNPLIKIKEGSLHFNRFVSFVHNNNEFIVNEGGQLIKKQP